MNVRHVEQEGHEGIDVTVTSAPGDERARRLAGRLQALDQRVVAYEPGSIVRRMVAPEEILLVELCFEHTCIRTASGLELESPLRLYEIEDALGRGNFVRASRQALVNFDKVVAIRPELNRRLMLRLEDGTNVLVTRTYVPDIRRLLKVG